MKIRMRTALMILAATLIAVAPMMAGSAIIGSVAGSMNATMGGQALVPNTTVFSGDSLQVREGAAVVAVGRGNRLVFGRATEASFLREGAEVTVLLGSGNVSLYQGQAGVSLRVKVGTVTVAPTGGFKTLGEVAMVNGAVVVTAKEGKLRVDSADQRTAVEVVKGKTITLKTGEARSPQGGAGSGAAALSGASALQVGAAAGSGVSAVLSGVAISRAGDARDAAASADATAANAVDAAEDAAAAADAAGEAANAAGCAINEVVDPELSPYKPPAGFSCD
jgi:hypothetical protein